VTGRSRPLREAHDHGYRWFNRVTAGSNADYFIPTALTKRVSGEADISSLLRSRSLLYDGNVKELGDQMTMWRLIWVDFIVDRYPYKQVSVRVRTGAVSNALA